MGGELSEVGKTTGTNDSKHFHILKKALGLLKLEHDHPMSHKHFYHHFHKLIPHDHRWLKVVKEKTEILGWELFSRYVGRSVKKVRNKTKDVNFLFLNGKSKAAKDTKGDYISNVVIPESAGDYVTSHPNKGTDITLPNLGNEFTAGPDKKNTSKKLKDTNLGHIHAMTGQQGGTDNKPLNMSIAWIMRIK